LIRTDSFTSGLRRAVRLEKDLNACEFPAFRESRGDGLTNRWVCVEISVRRISTAGPLTLPLAPAPSLTRGENGERV